MKKPSVTLKDLAQRLNLSVSTASRALRGEEKVHPQIAAAVRDLAEELHSPPNPIAKYDPDGIFVVCNTAAFGAMRALKAQHKRIPEEVALIEFTNERDTGLVSPSLSTIAQPSYEIGMLAAKILVDHVEKESAPIRWEQFRTELVIRESSDRTRA